MFYNKIEHVEIELTSRCNAACPQCVRNDHGGKTWHTLPIVDINFDVLTSALKPIADTVKLVRLCGTYGDPCIYKQLIDVVDWIHDNTQAKIVINTNASMRTVKWWKTLAEHLKENDLVYFGIDGLEDTHHLHRRGTDYNRIIRNLTTFNQAGGKSVWAFLVFEHNQHQVDEANRLSQELGCTDFSWKSTTRFIDKTHRLIDKSPVLDNKGKIVYWLHPVTDQRWINSGYQRIDNTLKKYGNQENFLRNTKINCVAQSVNMIHISAEGYLMPCGWLADRFYGVETENHPDHNKLFGMINASGGFDKININHNSIKDIVEGQFFQDLLTSWQSSVRLDRCANQCSHEHAMTSTSWLGIDIL